MQIQDTIEEQGPQWYLPFFFRKDPYRFSVSDRERR